MRSRDEASVGPTIDTCITYVLFTGKKEWRRVEERVRRRSGPAPSLRGQRQHANAHRNGATVAGAQLLRGSVRQIDDPAGHVRTAIIDANLDRAAVPEVRHEDPCAQRQGAMGSRELVHIVDLAACGAAAMVRLAIPRCLTGLTGGSWPGLRNRLGRCLGHSLR